MIDVDYNEYKETIAENMKLIVENNRLKEVEKEHRKLNGELREEIERLNNIINELEKYSEKMIREYNEAIEYSIDNIDRFNLLGARSSYREISNKIKELKGVDKE